MGSIIGYFLYCQHLVRTLNWMGISENRKIRKLKPRNRNVILAEIPHHGNFYGRQSDDCKVNGEFQNGDIRDGRRDSKYTHTRDKYNFRMFLGCKWPVKFNCIWGTLQFRNRPRGFARRQENLENIKNVADFDEEKG